MSHKKQRFSRQNQLRYCKHGGKNHFRFVFCEESYNNYNDTVNNLIKSYDDRVNKLVKAEKEAEAKRRAEEESKKQQQANNNKNNLAVSL